MYNISWIDFPGLQTLGFLMSDPDVAVYLSDLMHRRRRGGYFFTCHTNFTLAPFLLSTPISSTKAPIALSRCYDSYGSALQPFTNEVGTMGFTRV